jgi:hypothetical protein
MQADFPALLSSLLPASLPAPVARAATRFLGLEEAARISSLQSMDTARPMEERLLHTSRSDLARK